MKDSNHFLLIKLSVLFLILFSATYSNNPTFFSLSGSVSYESPMTQNIKLNFINQNDYSLHSTKVDEDNNLLI